MILKMASSVGRSGTAEPGDPQPRSGEGRGGQSSGAIAVSIGVAPSSTAAPGSGRGSLWSLRTRLGIRAAVDAFDDPDHRGRAIAIGRGKRRVLCRAGRRLALPLLEVEDQAQGGGPVEVIRVLGVLKLAVGTMRIGATAYLSSRCSFHRLKPFTHRCASVFSMRLLTNWQ